MPIGNLYVFSFLSFFFFFSSLSPPQAPLSYFIVFFLQLVLSKDTEATQSHLMSYLIKVKLSKVLKVQSFMIL